jgi:uncharacterized protein (DUF885 family)
MSAPAPASPVRALAERVFAYRLSQDWHLRARQGLPVEHLRVEAEPAWAADAAFAREVLDALARTGPVDEDDRLTAGFLEHLLGGWVERDRHALLGFTVTPYSSFFLGMPLQRAFPVHRGTSAGYLALAADYRDQVRELSARLLRQREAGVLLPAPAVPGVLESLRRSRAAAAAVLPGPAPAAVREQVERLVDAEVLPAYDRALQVLGEDYQHEAPTQVGQAQHPGGEAHYRALVRQHTASDLTPEQLHALGTEQVDALAEAMAEARARMGVTCTEEEFHAQLRTDPRLVPTSPEQVEQLFLRHMAALEPLIEQWFAVLPEAPYGVARLEPQLEAGMTYGYYEIPTPDQPVGRYRWNGSDLGSKSMLTYATLIFHELAPGHHFHMARQAENEALPEIRRECMEIGAFNEGWAEYAAGLGWEMGLYDDPLDAYGRLVHERFTAQRMVVDTGMNLLGWSLDEGAAYMRANTTESDGQIATEVLRYATDLPGQALSYRGGFVELTRLRAQAETALGSRFDVRAFHEELLGPGALPFPVIEGHLQRWAEGVA